MRLLKLGARVVLGGREVEVIGFTSMSVVPRRVFLRDLETDETFDIEEDGAVSPHRRSSAGVALPPAR